jgi:hypothetical protein
MKYQLNRNAMALAIASLWVLATVGASEAAPSDVVFLQSYVGNYTGSGTVSGSDGAETVRCKLRVQLAKTEGTVNYAGRCSVAGGSFAMSGAIAFVGGQYLAAMSSSMGVSGSIVGQKRRGGVAFAVRKDDVSADHDRTIDSTLVLAGGGISVEFKSVDNKTGGTTTGSLAFAKTD